MAKRLKRKYVERHLKRGRLIECQGCPTVTCTCFTELEDDLLEKTRELLKALGFYTYAQFAKRAQHDEKINDGPVYAGYLLADALTRKLTGKE